MTVKVPTPEYTKAFCRIIRRKPTLSADRLRAEPHLINPWAVGAAPDIMADPICKSEHLDEMANRHSSQSSRLRQ